MGFSDPKSRVESALRGLSEHERKRLAGPRTVDESLLGKLALDRGLVSPDQLDACLREQAEARARGQFAELGEILVQKHGIKSEDLLALLKEHRRVTEGLPELARYEVQDRLGEGAVGIVYRAWDRELARAVALKLLKERPDLSGAGRHRFRREAQVMAGLAHPNVVTVHDAGEKDGRLYLVMELVEGGSLTHHLAEGSRDEKEIVRLLEKVARGVAAAHEKGVVHRDLKPGNIFVTAAGEPKVGDFGLAHLADTTLELTSTGTTLGTPLYMSPEQVEGRSKEITPRTDVYALGAILYEGVTGKPPHTAETTMEIYRKIVREDPVPPRKSNPKLSKELETIILRALEKRPDKRYATAQAFAEDLRRYQEGKLIEARPVSDLGRVWRKAAKHRAIVLPSLGAALLAGLFGTWAIANAARKTAKMRETLAQAIVWEKEGRIDDAYFTFKSMLESDRDNGEAQRGLKRTDAEVRRRQRQLAERAKVQEEALKLMKVPQLEQVQGEVYVIGEKGREPARSGHELAFGQELETRGESSLAVVRYLDATVLELRGNMVIHPPLERREGAIGGVSVSKSVFLSRGSLDAEVTQQPAGQPMVILTPHAEATVVGTRLALSVAPDATRLEVREGRVKLRRTDDGASLEVTADHWTVVKKGTALAVELLYKDEIVLRAPQGRIIGGDWLMIRDAEASAGYALEALQDCKGYLENIDSLAKAPHVVFSFYAEGDKTFQVWVRGCCTAQQNRIAHDAILVELPASHITHSEGTDREYGEGMALFNGYAHRPGYWWIAGQHEKDPTPVKVRFARSGLQTLNIFAYETPMRIDALWLSVTQQERPDDKQTGPAGPK